MSTQMSESESLVMETVWQSQTPMSPGDVLNNLPPSCRWKYKTVATFLTRLTDKGILSCEKQGKVNMYTPKLTKQEYIEMQTRRFLNQYHNGSVSHLIAAMFKKDMNKDKLDKLLALIDKED